MRFIKENPALAAGIGLPFLLVIFFSFSTVIMQWAVEPPKYDVLFTVQNSQCINDAKVRFDFSNGRIVAKYNYPKKENNYTNCYDGQKIYRFEAKKLGSKEITFTIAEKNEADKTISDWHNLQVEELANLQIDNNQVAPDGYIFGTGNGYYRGGFFPFFGGYNYRDGITISKNGRTVRLLQSDN
ncbi:MAG: hypothetical protein ABL857_09140, partial [Rickettsiales bacterium]